MIELDGNYGEGGGALLRIALALSVLTGKAFKIKNIRAGRPNPGLKAQHLTCITAIKQMCPGSKSSDVALGEKSMWFSPTKMKSGNYSFNIGTAGSITLFSQAIILPAMFAANKITINIKGGTCGKWQASVDYLQRILIPLLERFVKSIKVTILKRGYYPSGGGECIIEISPKYKLKNFTNYQELIENLNSEVKKYQFVSQGKLVHIKGFVNASANLAELEVCERIAKAAKQKLRNLNVSSSIDLAYNRTKSFGGEVLIWTIQGFENGKIDPFNSARLAASELIEKGKNSEKIGEEVANKLIFEINSSGAVDEYLADQLLQFMALLKGSKIKASKISEHSKTNMYVIEKFLDIKFETFGQEISTK